MVVMVVMHWGCRKCRNEFENLSYKRCLLLTECPSICYTHRFFGAILEFQNYISDLAAVWYVYLSTQRVYDPDIFLLFIHLFMCFFICSFIENS